jgi:hypothetical protein
MIRSRLRNRKPISEKGQIVWIGSRANEVLKAVPLTVATVYDEHKPIVPRLNPASLGFSSAIAIFDPLPDVFRYQLFDVDHGVGSWFSVVNDLLKFSRWAVIPRERNHRSQAAAIAQL